ncbi:MAG: host attachment protein [Gammaproteobacteria bacterium]
MVNTWIVVAESSRARIFAAAQSTGALTELDDLVHPQSRLHDRDLTSDLPGRAFDSTGRRHSFEQNQDPKRHEAEIFAKQIALHLETARNDGRFDQLVLIAPPTFLGLLRERLDATTAKQVTRTIVKDLITLNTGELRQYLADHA